MLELVESNCLLNTGINHNIDELLVGIVTQIRLKQAGKEGQKRSRVDKVGILNNSSSFFNQR